MEELFFIQQDVLPSLFRGLWVSIQLIVPSALCGLIVGIIIGSGQDGPNCVDGISGATMTCDKVQEMLNEAIRSIVKE